MRAPYCTCLQNPDGSTARYSDCPLHGAQVQAEFRAEWTAADPRPQAVQLAETTDEHRPDSMDATFGLYQLARMAADDLEELSAILGRLVEAFDDTKRYRGRDQSAAAAAAGRFGDALDAARRVGGVS